MVALYANDDNDALEYLTHIIMVHWSITVMVMVIALNMTYFDLPRSPSYLNISSKSSKPSKPPKLCNEL